MIDRRFFLGGSVCSLVTLAGCGGDGTAASAPTPSLATAAPTPAPTPTPAPAPTPTPAPPAPPPAPAPAPTPLAWQIEGDSYMESVLGSRIGPELGETVFTNGKGGSTFQEIRNRIIANTALRANPLLIWDGSANGHVLGSTEMELQLLGDIVAFKGTAYRNWLYIPSIVVPTGGAANPDDQMQRDLLKVRDRAISIYGAPHVFDMIPELQKLASGNAQDASDVAAGYPPRSLFPDGVHPNEATQRTLAKVLTAPGGPMAIARALT